MADILSPVEIINFIFDIIIIVIGLICYKKSRNVVPVYIAAAFAVFGISNVVEFLGLDKGYQIDVLFIIRALAYLLVIGALISFLLAERNARASAKK
jgi:uncharacterized membrane protein